MTRILFIFFTFSFLLFACNSKVEVAATANQIDSILLQDSMKPPVFKDSTVSSYVKEYDTFITNYLKALKSEDGKRIKNLQKQSEELIEKAKVVSGKLKTAAELDQYDNWMSRQQEKIQLLNNIK